ncbi:hypothetical protein GLOIN_2v1501821 [Rhizophagus irregularis DAOM 181602=DAOM 197198]|nr:hypothetical protein GLOIN_2v1501821 [Rhizophagus irregularis DAOM 181602=DAOM 197198]
MYFKILRMLYRDLTGDASLANDQISKEMEEILRLMMSLEDPSIIIDLRINNGFQGSNLIYFGMNLMDILMSIIILLLMNAEQILFIYSGVTR